MADPLLKWSAIVTLLLGAWWIYQHLSDIDVAPSNPQTSISVEQLPLPLSDQRHDKSRLVVVHVHTKNVGSVPIEVEQDALTLALTKLPDAPPPGWVDTRDLVNDETVSLLQKYADGETLEPGAEYDDSAAFVLPVGTLYLARSQLTWSDDVAAAQAYFDVH